ncbi:O-acetyl-ADP-ribose deacetylase [Kordiimonas lipolytica]|uniref:O-acetyl-ADP-ribose deacetylase n=1 Tax=Kordiimonas lipolytica TaxID=1662421 RepID=A0ABV8U6H3_9PROT|nr:O-acetyl-ADP-ribose deacetylase [Kordiimonas lipolytica]
MIRVVVGDITKLEVDAIVNAANEALAPGGGVCGAIHQAAGPGLAAECQAIGHCETGHAKITGGHGLQAHHVIHTVGPVWHGGDQGEADLLASCYRHSLDLADRHKLISIAFPAISTGIFGYPIDKAARVAANAIQGWLDEHPSTSLSDVRMVCFNDADAHHYSTATAENSH